MTYPFYNPREVGGPTLEAMLVGRWPLVEEIIADLRRQATSASRQHWLLRGPRGIGKTHLIGVIYHRVRKEPELEEVYLPVWLAEMEAYTFYSTAVLLLEAARQLAEELRKYGDRSGAEDLENALAGLEAAGDDPALFEEILVLLRSTAKRRGKILLVLMENLDAMIAGFRSQPEARRFRAVLSEEKSLLFLSTTPTKYLRQLSDPAEPLYGHLRERYLSPLTEEEVGELFRRFINISSEHHLEDRVGPEGEGRLRRRLLHRLTGGNPRALMMAFSVLSGASGIRYMVEELTALLDAQTAYFEARLARLAPRERSIVAAMALAPTNLTRQEIARATRLPERSLSIQIKRLIEEGHVGQAVGEGGKGTIYELSDGLFRVWFQYRKGRKKLEPLVRFLAFWYAPEDLELAQAELKGERAKLSSLIEEDRVTSVAFQLEEALRLARSDEGEAEREQMWTTIVEEELGELVSSVKAAILEKGGRLEEAEAASRQVIERFGDCKEMVLQELVVRALVYLAVILGELRRSDEAIAVTDEVVSRYGGREKLAFSRWVALAFLYKGSLLRALDRSDEAIALYDEVVSRYGRRQELALAEPVVRALVSKGVILFERDRTDEAITTYDTIVSRYGERQEPSLVALAATALVSKAWSLSALGEAEQAINLLEEVVSCYGKVRNSEVQIVVARALTILAILRGILEKPEEAIQAYREAVTRLDSIEAPVVQDVAPLLRHGLMVLEAAQPHRGAHKRKGPATRLRESLGRVPPELREAVRGIAEIILYGRIIRGNHSKF